MKTQEQLQAIMLLSKHDHEGKGTTLEKSNCSACALNGYGDKKNGKPCAPNYAGWARIYVQAGKEIPAKYMEAFAKELQSPNIAYREALQEDIKKYQ